MIPSTLRSFVDRLVIETDKGRLAWRAGRENTFICERNKYTLLIAYHLDENSEESSYNMKIRRGDSDAYFGVSDREADYDIMKQLFDGASVTAASLDTIEEEFFDS